MKFALVVVFACLVANSMAELLSEAGPNPLCHYGTDGQVGYEQETIACIGLEVAGPDGPLVARSDKYWVPVVNGKGTICCGKEQPVDYYATSSTVAPPKTTTTTKKPWWRF